VVYTVKLIKEPVSSISIAFDKYYDPSLFKITSSNNLVWWDRAHNFIFDIGVTAGIPALMICP